MNRYPKHEHEYERDYSQMLCIHCGATQPTAPPNCPKCGHGWAKHDGRDDRLGDVPCCLHYVGMGDSCACKDLPPATLVAQEPHSRACGIRRHDHGQDCHDNCPTCHGKPSAHRPAQEPADPLYRQVSKIIAKHWLFGDQAEIKVRDAADAFDAAAHEILTLIRDTP